MQKERKSLVSIEWAFLLETPSAPRLATLRWVRRPAPADRRAPTDLQKALPAVQSASSLHKFAVSMRDLMSVHAPTSGY